MDEQKLELQEYKKAVLNGIDWSARECHDNPLCETTCLHIGQVGDFQIYLSESPNLRDENTQAQTYTMSLWEMNVHTKNVVLKGSNDPVAVGPGVTFNDTKTLVITRPGYTQLISDKVITAMDINEAKMACVNEIVAWNTQRLNEMQAQYDRLYNVFGNLNVILSDKVKAQRAADSIKTLNLPNPAVNALFNAGIHVIGELTCKTAKEIKNLKGLGGKAGQDILFALKSAGIILPQ